MARGSALEGWKPLGARDVCLMTSQSLEPGGRRKRTVRTCPGSEGAAPARIFFSCDSQDARGAVTTSGRCSVPRLGAGTLASKPACLPSPGPASSLSGFAHRPGPPHRQHPCSLFSDPSARRAQGPGATFLEHLHVITEHGPCSLPSRLQASRDLTTRTRDEEVIPAVAQEISADLWN